MEHPERHTAESNEGDTPVAEVVARGASPEQQRQDLMAHLRLALGAAELGTWRWDLATGEVIWDARMEELFGFPPGGFDGTFRAYEQALHPDDRAEVLATVDRAMEERSRYRVEHRVVLPDGSTRWIHGAGQVTVDATGEPTGAIGCSMDVTDRIEARRAAEAAAERERTDRERFEFLTEISDALADATSTEAIMRAVTRSAVPKLGDWCSIFVLPADGGRVPEVETFHIDPELVELARALSERYPFDPDAPSGIAAVIRTGQPEFFPEITPEVLDDAMSEAGFSPSEADELRDVFARLALRSAISVPLVKHGRILGALSFTTTTDRRAFTEQDLDLARVVAGRVASSVENRRLADAQRRIAATLQASLLPTRLPDVPGLDIAVRYWAAGEATVVGGDFYDVFAVDDGRWVVVVGDVCGSGPAAAALTSLARHTIRLAAWMDRPPAELFGWLNRAVRETADDLTFLTAAYVTLTRAGGGFDIAVTRAGHPSPVVVRSGGEASGLGAGGGLIGAFERVGVTTVTAHLDVGDTLVLYTDGLTDVPPPNGLTPEEATDLIAGAARGSHSAKETAVALEHRVEDRLALQHRPDDIAVVVLCVKS